MENVICSPNDCSLVKRKFHYFTSNNTFLRACKCFSFFFCFVLMVYYILEAEHKLLLKSLLIATPQK